MKPCKHEVPQFRSKDGKAEPYKPTDCLNCWLYATRVDVNRAWGGAGDVIPVRGESGCGCMRWVTVSDLARDAVTLAGLLPHDTAAIVGVPRSGMIPASIIATLLHLPLWELTADGMRPTHHGRRGTMQRPGPFAVVEDTVYSGAAMQRAKAACPNAVYTAVYVKPGLEHAVDMYTKRLCSPHLLEWNFMNNGPMRGHAINPVFKAGLATDLDGILCHDDQSGGKPGSPYMLPRMLAVPMIVTGRHEAQRGVTEQWLRQQGARWDALHMLQDGEPQSAERIAKHKAAYYGPSPYGFFMESCPVQAALIHAATSKPVICPAAGKVWHP